MTEEQATFTCEQCGGTFPKAWTDEEQAAEYAELFPAEKAAGEETAVVCDDCWREITGLAQIPK